MMTRVLAVFRFLSRSGAAPARAAEPHPVPPPARSRRGSARAAVWSGAAALAAATLALAGALEGPKPEWRDPEFGHRLKQIQKWKEAAPGRPLVLVVGSSRAQMGLSPAAMGLPSGPADPLVYNLALMGAPPVGIRFQLFRALDAGVRPDYVLAEVFIPNIATGAPLEKQGNWVHPARLSAGDVELLAGDAADPAALWRQWAGARLTGWSSHRQSLMSNWLPKWIRPEPAERFNWLKMDEYGFAPFPLASLPPEIRERFRENAALHHWRAFQRFEVHPRPDAALRELVGRCKAEGVPVALFRTPESPWFRSQYKPECREAAEHYFASLGPSLGVPVFPAPDLPEEAFADGHHLYPHAAPEYSRWLADTYLKPWLARHGK